MPNNLLVKKEYMFLLIFLIVIFLSIFFIFKLKKRRKISIKHQEYSNFVGVTEQLVEDFELEIDIIFTESKNYIE